MKSSGNTQFLFHLKLLVRLALYHCCPVSCSKRPVVFLCCHVILLMWPFVYKMKENHRLNWMWKTDFSLHKVLICRKCWFKRSKTKSLMSFSNITACCCRHAWCFNPVVKCLCYCFYFVICISKCKFKRLFWICACLWNVQNVDFH